MRKKKYCILSLPICGQLVFIQYFSSLSLYFVLLSLIVWKSIVYLIGENASNTSSILGAFLILLLHTLISTSGSFVLILYSNFVLVIENTGKDFFSANRAGFNTLSMLGVDIFYCFSVHLLNFYFLKNTVSREKKHYIPPFSPRNLKQFIIVFSCKIQQ